MIAWAYALLWAAALAYVVHVSAAAGQRWTGRAATGTAAASWILLTAGLLQRGLAAGHWPLTNRYEFALCLAWAIVAIYLLLEASWRTDEGRPRRQAGPFVLGVALLVATHAVTRPPRRTPRTPPPRSARAPAATPSAAPGGAVRSPAHRWDG